LTELGIDFVARQVPAVAADRRAMRRATGYDEIPVLVLGGVTLHGEEEIIHELNSLVPEPAGAVAHTEKAHEHEEGSVRG
jgi:hypothetical protein